MANLFDPKDRHVLPNWRRFELTVDFGELNDLKTEGINQPSHNLSIEDYLFSWKQNKTVAIAGDLLSAAFVNGFTNNPTIKEAADFILSNSDKSTSVLSNFAKRIVGVTTIKPEKRLTLTNQEDITTANNYLSNLIRVVKNRLNKYPLNPILYVELSRLYSILGYREKALRNMSIALRLAPENRFILRAASRLYTRFDLADYVHNIIKKSEIVKYDPWITSTEIALATIMRRSSKFIKTGIQMINSGKYSPFSLTELASSIGTLEFLDGNKIKTKKLLQTALKSPNDNSLAQVEWIVNKMHLFDVNPANYRIENKYEALALYNFYNSKWNEALENSIYWFRDLPFSSQPVIFGSHIAGTILYKRDIAINFLEKGLVSHPNDAQIINNIAYFLTLDNKVGDAENYLRKVRYSSEIKQTTKICLKATRGLIFFRKGLHDEGRHSYLEAISESKSLRNNNLLWLATLNYAREEILTKSSNIKSIIENVKLIPDNTKYPDINKLKADVMDLYHKTVKI